MTKWWNLVITVTLPFDTQEEAMAYRDRDSWPEALWDLFGENTVIGGRIEEADSGKWPWNEVEADERRRD
jgi:hypothetical protein